MRKLRVALFDLDDTLHDDTNSYMSAATDVALGVSARIGAEPNEIASRFGSVLRAFWKGLTVEEMRRGVEQMRSRMWHQTLASFGVEDEELARSLAAQFDERRVRYYRLFPGALALLVKLRRLGVKTGLVSNGFAVTHREKIGLLGLEPYFDSIFLSDEVSFVKPDPQFFEFVCVQMNEAPAATAMVGDRYDKDLVGAIEIGLFTVLVNTHRKPLPSGSPRPDAVVDTIAAAGDILLSKVQSLT